MTVKIVLGYIIIGTCLCVASCDLDSSSRFDRAESPEASFNAARQALRHRDLTGYFDALTDQEVRRTLSNSIGICKSSKLVKIQQHGYEPSVGCEALLDRYGWVDPDIDKAQNPTVAWTAALAKIKEPRRLVAELEELHRDNRAGSSFVWEWLESVKVHDVTITGATATGIAEWSTGAATVKFEKDETGWRFDPSFE